MRMRAGDHRITIEAPRKEVWRLIEGVETFTLWWPRQAVPIEGKGQIARGNVWEMPRGAGPPVRTEVDLVDPERRLVLHFWLPRGSRPAQIWTLTLEDVGSHCHARLQQDLDWEMLFRFTYGPAARFIVWIALPVMLIYFVGYAISRFLKNKVYPFTLMSDLRKLKKAAESQEAS